MSFKGARRINAAGEGLIKQFESLRLSAYRCPAGCWTIGYGHTLTAVQGLEITEAQADQLLRQDVQSTEAKVVELVQVALNDNQFAALVSFTFNIGHAALARSALLRRLNGGEYSCVPDELLRWVNVKGELSRGLVRRRIAEGKLWSLLDEESAMKKGRN